MSLEPLFNPSRTSLDPTSFSELVAFAPKLNCNPVVVAVDPKPPNDGIEVLVPFLILLTLAI